MTRGTTAQPELVVASNFVLAARDNGYISLATALGELIDNSIQASASRIDISITRAELGANPTITVTDNGTGMSRRELSDCLKFGGTSRFNNRASLGRYGMGLPAASLSQARTVSVDTWQIGTPSWRVTLCLAEAVAANLSGLRPTRIDVDRRTDAGCRVTWHDCDRIEYQRLGWLERALTTDLGRIFRRFIQSGLTLTVNGRKVLARDPLFLDPHVDSCQGALPCAPMQYEMTGSDGLPTIITVRFAELPVARLHDLDTVSKRRIGIIGNAGVSVLRGGREIAYGWHLMGGKRKENYDDWWRCEIEFEPTLDEEFGITNSKQGIRPSSLVREALEPDLEAMARLLNARVREAFEAVKLAATTQRSCRIAHEADDDLPVIKQRRGGRLKRVGGLDYQLHVGRVASDAFIAVDLRDGVLHATMNTDHPAFPAIYKPLITAPVTDVEELRVGIELLVLAYARTQIFLQSETSRSWESFPVLWSETLAKMLRQA